MDDVKLFQDGDYAIVEVMGHNTFAGKVSQQVIGGTAFVRVDIPAMPENRRPAYNGEYIDPAIPAFTKIIGAGSIYAITPCTEAVARQIAESKRVTPVYVLDSSPQFVAKQLMAAGPDLQFEDDEDDEEEEEDEEY